MRRYFEQGKYLYIYIARVEMSKTDTCPTYHFIEEITQAENI